MNSKAHCAHASSRIAFRHVLHACLAFLILTSATHAATFTVNTLVDKLDPFPSSPLSLREALRDAAATIDPDTIIFAPALNGQTIVLNSEIPVNDLGGVTVDASSLPNGITINGGSGPNRIFLVGHAAPTSLTLRRLTLTGGDGMGTVDTGLNGQGGAIHNRFLGNLTLERCTLAGNTVGGAIFNAGTLTLTRCTLSGNSTTSSGGAIQNALGTATLVQCTLSGNTANSTAGHIINDATLILRHCTLTLGQAGGGVGGIHNLPTRTLTLERCLVTANTSGGSPADIINVGTCNVEGTSVVGAYGGNAATPAGSGGSVIPDPPPFNRLAPLLNNGGPTATHALLLGSPAIDAGVGSTATTDQRGKPLVGPPDVGAFEAQNGGTFVLGAASHSVNEGGSVTVTVQRTDGIIGPASVRVITVAGTATAADYTERANTAAATVTFGHGDTTPKTVTIPIALDAVVEGTHSFTVRLVSPTPVPPSTLGTPNIATVTIRDAIVVTNLNDYAPGSLRVALATAASTAGADVITFAPALSGKTMFINDPIPIKDADGVTVDASNLPAGITIDGSLTQAYLFILPIMTGPAFTTVHFRGLTMTGVRNPANVGTIVNQGSNLLLLTRCTLSGNEANTAGAIYASGGTTELTQCTISGNTATTLGGAIYMQGSAIVRLRQCTLSDNTATGGGGVHMINTSTLILDRSILLGNHAASGADIKRAETTTTINLDGASVVGVFDNPGAAPTGSGSIIGDPAGTGLVPLANNGGATRTHALPPGSPALNAGDGSTLASDQRGKPLVGDPDIGAYEVQPGGNFVLEAPGYSVDEGLSLGIVIRRTVGFGPAKVRLFTTPGTASAADFTGRPNTVASDVDFADGDATKTISIATTPSDGIETNESFTVALGSPTAGMTVGPPSSAKVTIIDDSARTGDSTRPGIPTITVPTSNAAVNVDVGGTVTVEGVATDNKGVKQVTASLNGGAAVLLTLTHPGATSTAFSGKLPGALAGVNKLTVTTSDFVSGGPTTPSAERIFRVLRPLPVTIGGGDGTVTPGFSPKSYRTVGAPLTIAAAANPGYLFMQWNVFGAGSLEAIGINGVALQKPTLTFIHREGLRLAAQFVPNPFVPAVVGTYNGSIRHSIFNGFVSPAGVDTEGYISVKVQPTGAFSASLKIDGLTLPLAGTFDFQGFARFGTSRDKFFQLLRPNKPTLNVALTIKLIASDPREIIGSVSQFNATQLVAYSVVDADFAPFSSTNPVPTVPYLTASGTTATYTGRFKVEDGGSLTADQFPQGFGYGSFTLSPAGIITLAATLPDNTVITQSTTLTQAGRWVLFAQMYPGLRGCIRGNILSPITDADFGAPLFNESEWYCPIIDRQHYPMGWQEPLEVTFAAAKYTVSPGVSVLPLAQATGTGNGNATLIFDDGLLPSPLSKNVDISSTDAVTEVPVDADYILSINRSTGRISGTFLHPDGTRPAFNGIIIQKPGIYQGAHGFFMTTIPAPKTYDGQSGGVLLDPQ